jgi:hypothetical protein
VTPLGNLVKAECKWNPRVRHVDKSDTRSAEAFRDS